MSTKEEQLRKSQSEITSLQANVDSILADFEKAKNGNKSAIIRVRHSCQAIRESGKNLRAEIQVFAKLL